MRSPLVLALASLALGGCGGVESDDPTPHPEVTAADSTVALVGRDKADLVLIVSNQSLDDEQTRLTVAVDGVTVVDDDFHVEDQHNWIYFPLSLSPGSHEVGAESDSGATLRESFEVPRNKTRFAIIEHWTEDDSSETDDAAVDLPGRSCAKSLRSAERARGAGRRHPIRPPTRRANHPLIGMSGRW